MSALRSVWSTLYYSLKPFKHEMCKVYIMIYGLSWITFVLVTSGVICQRLSRVAQSRAKIIIQTHLASDQAKLLFTVIHEFSYFLYASSRFKTEKWVKIPFDRATWMGDLYEPLLAALITSAVIKFIYLLICNYYFTFYFIFYFYFILFFSRGGGGGGGCKYIIA